MRVSANTNLIKRRARFGTIATFAGLGVLIAGMIASFQIQLAYLSLGALVIGFALSQYGSYSLRRWGRAPRPDQRLEESLKGFDDRYHLYTWALPAPYVLLSPQGVYSFAVRDQGGQISVNGSEWRSKFSLGRMLMAFGQEGLGNPTREAQEFAASLEKAIKANLPDMQVAVQPVVVFLNDRVDLQVDEPAIPVLQAKNLKKWLRGTGKAANLKTTEYRALEELFDSTGHIS